MAIKVPVVQPPCEGESPDRLSLSSSFALQLPDQANYGTNRRAREWTSDYMLKQHQAKKQAQCGTYRHTRACIDDDPPRFWFLFHGNTPYFCSLASYPMNDRE
jgi:hypothetical protein